MTKAHILSLVEKHKYVRREMIQQATGMQTRNCQHVLRDLTKKQVLYRFKLARDETYIYHIDKPRSAKWRHWVAINEFHFALMASLKPGQKVLYCQLEYRYSHGQSDALYVIQTRKDGGVSFFLEVDDGANQFDKVEKYERYYIGRQWAQEVWQPKDVPVFPMVVCVTPRVREIEKLAGKAEKVAWRVYGCVGDAVKGLLAVRGQCPCFFS